MNKTVLITGASSCIGRELAKIFAYNNYNLVLVSKDEKKLIEVADNIKRERNISIHILIKDLFLENSSHEIYDELKKQNKVIDILVNNAGQGQLGDFVDIPLSRDIELIRLNIESLTRMTKLFLTDMIERGDGKILNLGSIAGFQPGPKLSVYHATKAYVVSFSEALHEELKDSGIVVTCLCPGPTFTKFFSQAGMENTRVVKHRGQTMMSSKEVAQAGFDTLMSGERLVVPGTMNKILTFTRRIIPISLQAKIQKSFYEDSGSGF